MCLTPLLKFKKSIMLNSARTYIMCCRKFSTFTFFTTKLFVFCLMKLCHKTKRNFKCEIIYANSAASVIYINVYIAYDLPYYIKIQRVYNFLKLRKRRVYCKRETEHNDEICFSKRGLLLNYIHVITLVL